MCALDGPVYSFGHILQELCTFPFFQALEDMLDVFRGNRLMPVCHEIFSDVRSGDTDVAGEDAMTICSKYTAALSARQGWQ